MRAEFFRSIIVLLVVCGCGGRTLELERSANQMVYVDLQTRTPIVSEQTDVIPAVHPATGERSLMPGQYCSACARWHPAPPLDVLQRNPAARQCPDCKAVMSGDGPWPEPGEPQE